MALLMLFAIIVGRSASLNLEVAFKLFEYVWRQNPTHVGVQKKQTQISRFAAPSQLFSYTDENNKLELA